MLLGRPQFALGFQRAQCLGQCAPRLRRLDHVVHQPAPGGHKWVGKRIAIQSDQLLPLRLLVRRLPSISLRKTISAAPSAPITAISAVGQASTRSAPRSFEHIAT